MCGGGEPEGRSFPKARVRSERLLPGRERVSALGGPGGRGGVALRLGDRIAVRDTVRLFIYSPSSAGGGP